MLQMITKPTRYGLMLFAFILLGLLIRLSPAGGVDAYYLMNSAVEDEKQSIPLSEFLFPNEYERVLAAYRAGNFRLCILELSDLIRLGLPDGRIDNYLFMAGECYHQLKLDKFAFKQYTELLDEHPESPYCRFAAYRLQEDAYLRSDEAAQKRYFAYLMKRFPGSEIAQASLFLEGKRLYKTGEPAEADKLLAGVSEKSDMYCPAAFVRGICAIQTRNYEKAVLQLSVVQRRTGNLALRDEAILLLSDIYHKLKKDDLAAKLLKDIGPNSAKYGDALLFQAQFSLAKNEPLPAVQAGMALLEYRRGNYMFEAAMVLESAYMKLSRRSAVDSLRTYLELTVRKRKLIFQLYRELDLLTDMQSNFTYFCQKEAARLSTLEARHQVTAVFDEYTNKIRALKDKDAALLYSVDRTAYVVGSSGIHEIRYIEYLDRQVRGLTQRTDSLAKVMTLYTAKAEGRNPEVEKAYLTEREGLLNQIQSINELKDDIRTFCLSENPYLTGTEEVEAKFVDWNLMHLDEMKNRLRNVYRELSRLQQQLETEKAKAEAAKPPATPVDTAIAPSVPASAAPIPAVSPAPASTAVVPVKPTEAPSDTSKTRSVKPATHPLPQKPDSTASDSTKAAKTKPSAKDNP